MVSSKKDKVNPEVKVKRGRRTFTREYKLKIVKQAAECKKMGEQGALLRREGLYSSHLVIWRKAYKNGELEKGESKKRGRKEKEVNPLEAKLLASEKERKKLEKQLEQAQLIIEAQKKISQILEISLEET